MWKKQPEKIHEVIRCPVWAVFILLSAHMAGAHALGNFTLNHTTILELTGRKIVLHTLADYAEVPSFEQFQLIDADQNLIVTPIELKAHLDTLATSLVVGHDLKIQGKRPDIQLIGRTPRLSEGVIRVTCLQLLLRLEATLPDTNEAIEVRYDNRAYTDRLGLSDVRLLWSPEWDITGVTADPSPDDLEVEPISDSDRSLLMAGTRGVRFQVKSTGQPSADYQPLKSQFAEIDPYLNFNLIPPLILQPDEHGQYEIFHVKLSKDVVDGRSTSALNAGALSGLPAIPGAGATGPVEASPPSASAGTMGGVRSIVGKGLVSGAVVLLGMLFALICVWALVRNLRDEKPDGSA